MTFDRAGIELLTEAVASLEAGFADLPDIAPEYDQEAVRTVLLDTAVRMRDNYPYQHPLYAGQMLKPPHPIARLAYALAQFINPNNHSFDGGRASSAMEKEAVADLARVFGWETHLGHLCSNGTIANMEALWVAGRLAPDTKIVASSQAHFTHARLSEVLKLDFESIAVDERGRMDLTALERVLDTGEIGSVVATLGTTGLGAVDPLAEILTLRERYPFRLHVDAAYGGYFTLIDDLAVEVRAAYDCIGEADSIVIDPHKHGLQPYGCGCVLFRDPAVGALYKHDSPYTYFSSDELHLGEISLECSRAGAAATALWATHRLLPPVRDGAFAKDLTKCRAAASAFHERLAADPHFRVMAAPDLDIVVWALAGNTAREISERSRRLFNRAADADLHFALIDLPEDLLRPHWPGVGFDTPNVTCLRACLMKPEHLDWLDRIWRQLDQLVD